MTEPQPTLLDRADTAMVDVDRIRAAYEREIGPLREIADKARYLMAAGAYQGCIEDGVCEEEFDPCPHVTTHYATCTDRLVSERLLHLLGEVWALVRARPAEGDDIAGDLVDLLHTTACSTMNILDDADPCGDNLERPDVLTDIIAAYSLELTVWGETRREAGGGEDSEEGRR